MKKIVNTIISTILCLAVLLSLTIFSYAAENISNKVYSEEISINSGEFVDIPVYIKNNTGFSGFKIILEYNTEVFTPVTVTKGAVLSNCSFFNDSIGGSISDKVVIMCTSGKDIDSDGLLFTIKFSVQNSANGDYQIIVSYDQDDTFDSDFNDVVFECNNILVNVDGNSFVSAQKISLNSICGICDEKITVPVKITNNAGFENTQFTIGYDSSYFTPTKINNGLVNVISENISSSDSLLQINTSSLSANVSDGILFEIEFYVSTKANGDYLFTLNNSDNMLTENATISIENNLLDQPAVIYSDIIVCGQNDTAISVPVYIRNNQGLMGFKMILHYDDSLIKPTELIAGDVLSGSFGENNYNIEKNDGTIVIVWNSSQNNNIDGKLFDIKFDVISQLNEVSQITGEYVEEDTFNEKWENVTFEFENIGIYFLPDNLLTSKKDVTLKVESQFIYGFSDLTLKLSDCIELTNDEYNIIFNDDKKVNTGETVNIYYRNVLVKTFTAIVFGDVNGDGWYDGTDAIVVNCIANGMLTEEDVGEAVWAAADCNHDGVIDNLDVEILNQAGLLLAQVDQTKSEEELETSAVYQEYLDLIDQSPVEEETPTQEAENPSETKATFFELLWKMIIKIFDLLKSYIIVVK